MFFRFAIPPAAHSLQQVPAPLGWSRVGQKDEPNYCGWAKIILLTIADREQTPVLIMIIRRKAFTVFGLMFMRFAIALPVRPCSRYSNTSRSRCVRLNCRET